MTTGGPVVNHVGLAVADLDRAIAFYTEVLGFEVERRLRVPDDGAGPLLLVEPPVNLEAVYLRLGAFTLELLHFDRAGNDPARSRGFTEPGLTHLSFAVDDLDAAVATAVDHGAEVVSTFPGAAVVLRDPGGQLLELLPMTYRRALDG